MLSIEEIKNISFRKANFGGYKPEDVDTFIDQVLVTMEQLRKEKSDLIKKMDILATRVEEYRSDEDAVRNALLSAQRVADITVKEARAKAAKILEESENLAKAKLYDLNVQIKQQKKQYTLLLAEYNRVKEDIVNHCNKHIALLRDIPSEERIKAMAESVDERFPTDKAEDYEKATEVASTNADVQEVLKSKPEEVVSAENVTAAESVQKATTHEEGDFNFSDDNNLDINLVNDIGDKDITTYHKKKHKSFIDLKFGDNYDVKNDDGNADTDNT